MYTNDLCELIKLIKEQKDESFYELILEKLKPLILKYSRKLYFMEREDAIQEMSLAVIEAIHNIKFYDDEFGCLYYFKESVHFRYVRLCNKNIKKVKETYDSLPYDAFYTEKYLDVEFLYDIRKEMKLKTELQKQIVEMLINGMSCSKISTKINISRQYVYKVKNHLKEYMMIY